MPYPVKNPVVTLGYRQKMQSRPTYIHRGVDFGVSVGTSVYATAAGKVVHAGRGGMGSAFGIHVVVKVGAVYVIFAHLSQALVKSGASVIVGQKIGLSGATGNVTGPHLHYGEFTAYSYLSDRKPQFLATPAPAPTPPVSTAGLVKVVTVNQNVAGYNSAGLPGVTRYVKNVASIAAAVLKVRPDTFTVQELSNKRVNPMRALLGVRFGTAYRRAPGGSDGRYVYLVKGLTRIASGKYEAASSTLFNGDDKQAAWVVFRKDGALGLDVSIHTENENGRDRKSGKDANDLRVAQVRSFLTQALDTARKYGVPEENIMIVGDTNSEGMVRDAMKALGWKWIGSTTPASTYNGWGSGSAILDYAFVKEGVPASAEVVKVTDSDHNRIVIRRWLTKS